MKHKTTILGLLALTGCGWNSLPHQEDHSFAQPLWDAHSAVARTDAIYVHLPVAGALARITSDGEFERVDVGEGRVARILTTPDQDTLLTFVERIYCDLDEDDLADVHSAEDCPAEAQEILTELLVVQEGAVQQSFEISGHYNTLSWSEDGTYAIAYLDFSQGVDLGQVGVVDLTSVLVLDLVSGSATPVSVGFAADRVLFTHEDADGINPNKAVVLSQNSVAVVDLNLEAPSTEVTFPLTLDADQSVTPVGVELTPDNRYALISVQGTGDLYVLDLENRSVNMVSLSANPSAMTVDTTADRTVLVYSGGAVADILEHTYFDVETVSLDEPMNGILEGSGYSLLYNSSKNQAYHDIYRLDLDTGDLLEYRMQNPVMSLHLAQSEEYAIALTRAEGYGGSGIEGYYDASPGMEILDLRDPDKARSTPYLLESPAVGLAFSDTDTALHALVLQQSIDYLYQLDLYSGEALELDLGAAPVDIGSLPEGGFYITHDAGMGHITFYDPVTDELSEAFGFASMGLFDEYDIINSLDAEEVE